MSAKMNPVLVEFKMPDGSVLTINENGLYGELAVEELPFTPEQLADFRNSDHWLCRGWTTGRAIIAFWMSVRAPQSADAAQRCRMTSTQDMIAYNRELDVSALGDAALRRLVRGNPPKLIIFGRSRPDMTIERDAIYTAEQLATMPGMDPAEADGLRDVGLLTGAETYRGAELIAFYRGNIAAFRIVEMRDAAVLALSCGLTELAALLMVLSAVAPESRKEVAA